MLKGKRCAIVVGVNEYDQHDKIPPLPGALHDANEMYEVLSNSNIGNFDIPKDHFLTGQNATCKAIRKAISDVFWKGDMYDLLIFYFSGHGFTDSYENGYIAPYDMIYEAPLACGINMAELKQLIYNSPNKEGIVMMILDCCFSGIITQPERPIPTPETAIQTFNTEFRKMSGKGRVILASSGKDQTSKEKNDCSHGSHNDPHQHGAYTYCMLEALEGQAKSKTGILTVEELRYYAEERMKKIGKQVPESYMAGVSQLEEIQIALVDYSRYKEHMKQVITNATELLNDDRPDIYRMIKRAQAIGSFQNININDSDPDNIYIKNETDKIKSFINQQLGRYKGKITTWLTLNKRIRLDIKPEQLYVQLFGLEKYLDFDKLISAEKHYTDLLEVMCDAIDFPDLNDIGTVVERIRQAPASTGENYG